RMQPRGRRRIDSSQPTEKIFAAVSPSISREAPAKLYILSRPCEKSEQKRLQVEWRTTDNEDSLTSGFNVPAGNSRLFQPPGDARGFAWIKHIEQMVRNSTAQLDVRLCHADIHAPIKSHGVHAYYFRVETLRELDAEHCLARCRGASKDQRVLKRLRKHAS